MRKVVGGQLYDTSTAQAIGPATPAWRVPASQLYRTKRGNFFVATELMWDIEPLTRHGARAWVEENLASDAAIPILAEVFGWVVDEA